jgi:hypothetical protein
MKYYELYKLDKDQYNYFLLCLTYESILNYLDILKNDPFLQNSRGKLLIDQLLVAGNGKNRFISCDYSFGKIILSTATNVKPDIKYKDLTIKLLQQNFELLKSSILSDRQRDLIMDGISF